MTEALRLGTLDVIIPDITLSVQAAQMADKLELTEDEECGTLNASEE